MDITVTVTVTVYRCRIARCFALDVARPGIASSGRQPNGLPMTQECMEDFTAVSVTSTRPRLHDTRHGTTFSCFTNWFENSPRTEYSYSWTLSGRRGKNLIRASTSSCVTVATYGASKWGMDCDLGNSSYMLALRVTAPVPRLPIAKPHV